jgi:hypothetical protein
MSVGEVPCGKRNDNSDAAAAIVVTEEHEIALYERHSAFVSYYVERRTAD